MHHLPLLLSFLAAIVAVAAVACFLVRVGFPLPQARISSIDGLRGVAALSVMAHHFFIWLQLMDGGHWTAPAQIALNNLGVGAVSLFFMATGLVFYPRVLAGRRNPWLRIFIGRLFRLTPLVVVTTLVICAVIALRTGARPGLADVRALLKWVSAFDQPPLLGYADSARMNAHVLWSLKWEWVFYVLILPACALLRDLVSRSWLVPVALMAFSLPFRGVVEGAQFLPLFAAGMLAYEARLRFPALGRPEMTLPALAALLLATFYTEQFSLLAVALYGFVFTCVAAGVTFGVLQTRAARVLGECSFGIYLLHGLALFLMFDGGPGLWPPAILPVAAVAVVLVSALTFLTVERPGMALGRKIADAITGRRKPASGVVGAG